MVSKKADTFVSAFAVTCGFKAGTGGIYKLSDHLREGKYSPRDAHGKRISRNVYAKIREECDEKLAAMIEEAKTEIAAEKEKSK